MKRWHALAIIPAVALATLDPVAAYAARNVHRDAVGDVVTTTGDSQDMKPAPDQTDGDITSSTVSHLPRKVTVSVSFRDLAQSADVVGQVMQIRSNHRRGYRELTLLSGKGQWGGQALLTRRNGSRVRCHATKRLDYAHNRATVSIPRRCLGNPRWVQVAVATVSVHGTTYFVDDARAASTRGLKLVYGPRLRRG